MARKNNKNEKNHLRQIGLKAAVPLAAAFVFHKTAPPLLDKVLNRVTIEPPYMVSEEAAALHQRLFVADLHCDALLWNRDLLRRYDYGHIDLPRLIDGNVALQVFAAATHAPLGINFDQNRDRVNLIGLLGVVQGRPMRTWANRMERALFMAHRLNDAVDRAGGRMMLVKNAADLDALRERRKSEKNLVGALLALEGVHTLGGDLDNLDRLYQVGFRIIGLSHFIDNDACGSAHGWEKGGLTPFGRQLVEKITEKSMILDLAHTSPQVIDEVLDRNPGPLLVSHTGVRATFECRRNISDDHIRRIAETGGVIGIAFFPGATGGTGLNDVVRAIAHVAETAGVDHVALGSDYDGSVTVPVDASGMPMITQALLKAGFSESEIAKIMGQNAFQLLRRILKE